MRKYRRIIRNSDSSLQNYQMMLIASTISISLLVLSLLVSRFIATIEMFSYIVDFLHLLIKQLSIGSFIFSILFIFFYLRRDQVSTLNIPQMSPTSKKLSKKILRLFTDKQVTDVLKLSNLTRFGDEMPLIFIWVDNARTYGYIAIENICNFERMDREKYEQKLSGILSGKYKRFAIISSELSPGNVYMIFYFEDALTSHRLDINSSNQSLESFVSIDKHAICLAKDFTWHSDITPHMSIIARTRAGKSVFAGRYLAPLMLLQGWTVEYNSAKLDKYVKKFNGQHEAEEIVKRAEHWVNVMKKRLDEIIQANKEKYLEMVDMNDVAIFFDELGNLNAELESDKNLKKRWETAINKLTATGGSAGIHIIAISQFATKEGFLPSLARVNCSDAVIMLGGAADSADERKYLMSGFADMPKRSYGKGEGVARIAGSGKKWETPHFYEAPWFHE
jgi:hypothetical protein